MRYAACLSLLALPLGCFNPDPVGEGLETESGGSSTGGDATNTSPTSTNPTASTGDETGTDTADTTADTTAGAVCGDGEVNGDEVCDDGTNDGAYGGCEADCSALAPHCGDAEVNGDETCDDGTNDGAYGGCNDDCTLAAYCGDGTTDDEELCDEGGANENGSGCNIDCTTSGTLLDEDLETGLTFCDGAFTTPAQFTTEGNALVAATGYCAEDTQLLREFTPGLDVVQTFDVLMPDTPVRSATMLEDTWVLGASGCNYAIDADGMFAEVCDERETGTASLEAVSEIGYLALDYNVLSLYPPSSPAIADEPLWTANPPAPGFYTYSWHAAAPGPNDSVLVGGGRAVTDGDENVGTLIQFTAAGNQVDTNTYAAVEQINAIATGADGTALLYSRISVGEPGYPGGYLTQLNAAFGQAWSVQLTNPGNVQLAVDSTGAPIVMLEDGNGNGAYELRKLDPADGSPVWSIGLPEANNYTRISVGPDDYIWVTAAGYGGEGGQVWIGRVSP